MTTRLRDLLVDGLLLAIPLGAAGFLLNKAIGILSRLLVPAAHLLPEGRWFGIAAIEVAAFVVLLLGLILLGALARTTPGKHFVATLESVVLSKVPGYLIVKTITADLAATEKGTDLRPALVSFDDNTVLGFLVEEPAGTDACTLFLPSAPGAATGSVVIVPRERVQPLEASTGSAMRAMKQRGLGLQRLAQRAKGNRPKLPEGQDEGAER